MGKIYLEEAWKELKNLKENDYSPFDLDAVDNKGGEIYLPKQMSSINKSFDKWTAEDFAADEEAFFWTRDGQNSKYKWPTEEDTDLGLLRPEELIKLTGHSGERVRYIPDYESDYDDPNDDPSAYDLPTEKEIENFHLKLASKKFAELNNLSLAEVLENEELQKTFLLDFEEIYSRPLEDYYLDKVEHLCGVARENELERLRSTEW